MNSKSVKISIALIAGLAGGISLEAGNALENVQFGGFVSQGYIKSTGNNFPVDAKDGTFDFREVALNVNYASGNFRIGAQGFAQSLGAYGEDKPILDWAIVDYNFRREFGLRAGRVKYPRGLHGEALDVDFIRPFVFLPTGTYNPVLRDFNSAFDGVMAYGNIDAGEAGSFDYKLFGGDIEMGHEQGAADFFNNTSIFDQSGITSLGIDEVVGGTFFWNTPLDGIKLGYSYYEYKEFVGSGPLAGFPAVDAALYFEKYPTNIFSVEYLTGDWTFNAEYSFSKFDLEVRTPLGDVPGAAEDHNWYVSAARRINSRWEVGAYYSAADSKNQDPSVPASEKVTNDWALAVRFDATDRLVLKFENHWIDGTSNVFDTPRTPNPTVESNYGFFAAKATYNF